MARLLKTPRFHRFDPNTHDINARIQWEDLQFNELMAEHHRATGRGEVVGRIFSWPVADGAAYYLVKKEKPLTLQWINVGDCWQMPNFAIRGLRAEDIL